MLTMMLREKERMEVACIRGGDPEGRAFLGSLHKVTKKSMRRVASRYYDACSIAYEPTFFAWRNRIAEFQA